MSFSDSNRVAVRFVEESVWASTPAGSPMVELPITSESLKSNINTVTSDTIRSDRNVADITVVGGGAGGDVGFELKYGDWDQFLEGLMQNNYVSTLVSAGGASAVASGAAIIVADSSVAQNVIVGQFIRVANATTTVNGDYRVTAVSAVASGNTLFLADASTGVAPNFTPYIFETTATLKGNNLRNGTAAKSYTVEKEFADVSTTFQQYKGMRIGAASFSLTSQSILTGTFTLAGKSQATASTTIASTTTAASTNPVMNASGNVGRIWEGGDAVTSVSFKSITIDVNNNVRDQDVVGSDSLAGIGTGRCEVTGTLSAYFEDNSLLDKFVGGTATSIRVQVTDSDGASYIFTIPKIRFTDATVVATGPNNDVMADITWSAMVDDSGLYAIQIDQLPA